MYFSTSNSFNTKNTQSLNTTTFCQIDQLSIVLKSSKSANLFHSCDYYSLTVDQKNELLNKMKVEFEDLTAETKRITKEIKEKSKKVQDLRYLLDRLQEEESDEDLTCVFTVDSLQKSSNSLPTIKPIPIALR